MGYISSGARLQGPVFANQNANEICKRPALKIKIMKFVFDIKYSIDGVVTETEITGSGPTLPTQARIVEQVRKGLHPLQPVAITARFRKIVKEPEVRIKSKREIKREQQKQSQAS